MCFPPHSTHIMQPLDVSIFGPLTQAYRNQVTELGEQADKIDKSMFASMYSVARAKAITQTAARKAFHDCGMTIRPNEEKVLARIPGYTPEGFRTPSPPPRPDQASTPQDRKRFADILRLFERAESPRDRSILARKLQKAYDCRDAHAMILARQKERRLATARQAKRTVVPGDRKVISKDMMVQRDWAEKRVLELAAEIEHERVAREQQEAGPSTLVCSDQLMEDGDETPTWLSPAII